MWHSAVTSGPLVPLLLGRHVGHQVADTVAVRKLVVVPEEEKNIESTCIRKRDLSTQQESMHEAYHETSLTKWSLRAMPAPASKMEEWLSPLKSVETTCRRAKRTVKKDQMTTV